MKVGGFLRKEAIIGSWNLCGYRGWNSRDKSNNTPLEQNFGFAWGILNLFFNVKDSHSYRRTTPWRSVMSEFLLTDRNDASMKCSCIPIPVYLHTVLCFWSVSKTGVYVSLCFSVIPSVPSRKLTLLLLILEVTVSNLDLDTGHLNWRFLHSFSFSLSKCWDSRTGYDRCFQRYFQFITHKQRSVRRHIIHVVEK